MRIFTSAILFLFSINTYCQFSFSKVDSIVLNRKYKSLNLKELSDEVSTDFKSDINKVRAIYMYVVNNIKYDISLAQRRWRSDLDMDSIILSELNQCLKTKKGICWDYALLFQKLCYYQGIEVELITGASRNMTLMPQNMESNHAWNSLTIKGKRKFIDCTFVPPDKYNKTEYDKFFLVDPEEFIYRCLPLDSSKQYLKKAITYDQFRSFPYVRNAFYEHRIKNLSYNLLHLKIKPTGHYPISFNVTNLEEISSIEIYLNDKLVEIYKEINLTMNLNLNLKLSSGDLLEIMAITTIYKDSERKDETIAPLITYIAK